MKIHYEITMPYTHQHIGLDERGNMTFMNMVGCMFKEKKPPHAF